MSTEPLPIATPLNYDNDRAAQRSVLDVVAWVGLVVAGIGLVELFFDAVAFVRFQPTRWMEELMIVRALDEARLNAWGTLVARISVLMLLAGSVAYFRRNIRARLWFMAYAGAALLALLLSEAPRLSAYAARASFAAMWRWWLGEIAQLPPRMVLPVLLLVLTLSPRTRGAFLRRADRV